MTGAFTFRCNLDSRRQRRSDGRLIELRTFGKGQNVNVVIDDIARVFQQHLSGRLADALDIAAVIYAADSAVPRGGGWIEGAIEPWARDFQFEIGVRDLEFWTRLDVIECLVGVLNFLSDDRFRFRFYPLQDDRAAQQYLKLIPASPKEWPFQDPPRVLLFSGGLDSLSGAVEAAARGDNLVLVSHRSISVIDSRQQELFQRLKTQFPKASILRVPVWIHKIGTEAREYSQRTRSFLFWSLALVVGQSVNAEGMTFFENGVVSLNLPIADQVLRARASRTTHPITLEMLQQLSALVLNRPFVVENPYIYLTKTEVISKIVDAGAGDLIRSSRSCSRTRNRKAVGWHCGCCSQCIDRRIAAIASGHEEFDPESDYAIPVLTGARRDLADRTMAVNYVRHALELAHSSQEDVAEKFNTEFSRAARAFANPTTASRMLVDMHLRHGTAVRAVIAENVAAHTKELVDGTVEPTSLLGLVIDRQHLTASWKRFADRIAGILERGLPAACASQRPENEPRLQEICDGLLRAADESLVREYPYLRWASRMAKPDWSAPPLLVELKYVRTSSDVRKISEEIAADITKYGDSDRRTLFVVYDPSHHIIDELKFSDDIQRHEGNLVKIIR
jgi:7-cyano-7-deazaguanine synthase in queuosine biosynthesis